MTEADYVLKMRNQLDYLPDLKQNVLLKLRGDINDRI